MPSKSCALVVDDDAFIRIDASSILEDAGFRCLEAANGDEAWAILDDEAGDVSLLFTDVEMPGGMDGFELARRTSARYPDIEIVIASGRVTPKPGDIPPRASFIGKPFSAQVVLDHLKAMLPEHKKPQPLRD